MPDTYTQLQYHIVFSTKHRVPLITPEARDPLYGLIGGIVRREGGVLLAIGGMSDHVHLLAGWGTSLAMAKMLQLIKGSSSKWMNEHPGLSASGFSWQAGYSAFSVSASKVPAVRAYILNQEAHHRKMSFREEITGLLNRHGVKFDPRDFSEEDESPSVESPGRDDA